MRLCDGGVGPAVVSHDRIQQKQGRPEHFHEFPYNVDLLFICLLYTSKHLLSFVDNHDVTRVASSVNNENHLPLIYAMAFGMPGIPCVYYGSEWGFKARKEDGLSLIHI